MTSAQFSRQTPWIPAARILRSSSRRDLAQLLEPLANDPDGATAGQEIYGQEDSAECWYNVVSGCVATILPCAPRRAAADHGLPIARRTSSASASGAAGNHVFLPLRP